MKVGLFIPCYVDLFYPKVGISSLAVLESLGIDVVYPEKQTCCGQPIANSGMSLLSRDCYLYFSSMFSKFDYVVTPSASCAYHIRNHYDVGYVAEEVEKVRKNTYDMTEFLVDILNVQRLDSVFPHRVSFHPGCHGLRGLHLASSTESSGKAFSKWESLLCMVKGIEIVPFEKNDECCGFGGVFSVYQETLSVKMGEDKLENILKSDPEYVISSDSSCLMHLEGIIKRRSLPLKALHLVEVLASFNQVNT